MSEILNGLRERRQQVYAAAGRLLDRIEAEGSDLTGEARASFDGYVTELGQLDGRINDLSTAEERRRQAAPVIARYAGSTPAPPRAGGADVLRSFLTSPGRQRLDIDLREAHRSVDERTGRVTVGERRDLTVGSATGGGNTTPTGFVPRLVEHMIQTAAIRQTNVTVFQTDGGEDLEVPKTTAHSTAVIIAEGATIPESDPAFGQTTLQAFKYGGMIQVSTELLQDTDVDLLAYLARETGRAIGNASGAHFVTGTGTGQPRGVITGATVGKTGGTGVAGAFTADDLIDLFFSVIPQYRANGFWMMSDTAAAVARKLKGSDGHYLWETNLSEGTPPRLLGRPVVVDPNVPAPAVGAKSVVFGDFSAYAIRDVRQVRFERSDDYAFANDLVTFRYLFRTDGDLVDELGAVKVFQGGAS